MKYTDPDGRYTWAQFKSDIKFAIKTDFNFDFGYDCTQYAAAAWNNGDYLNFAGWEITATLEMGFDLLACYMGAEFLSAAVDGISVTLATGSVSAGLSAAQLQRALSDTSRIQHASRHLIASGILPNWSKNTAMLAQKLYTSILTNPEKTFEYTLKGGAVCDGFSKTIDGQKIMVLLYKTGECAGQIATSFVANQSQIESLGL